MENLLGSTGYFDPHGELLNKQEKEIKFPHMYLSGLSKYSGKFIFHVKTWHLCNFRKKPVDPKMFFERLHKKGWKIIYIDRHNKINQALSSTIADKRRIWHITEKEDVPFRLNIDCHHFVKQVKKREIERKKEKEILSNVEYIEVNYERDLENVKNHQTTVNRILEYLGLESRPATTKYKKVNRYSTKDIVLNYSEFKDATKKL